MFVPNLQPGRPTFTEAAQAFQAGKPASLFEHVSAADVQAAARERGLTLRDGRIELPFSADVANLVFAVRDYMSEVLHVA